MVHEAREELADAWNYAGWEIERCQDVGYYPSRAMNARELLDKAWAELDMHEKDKRRFERA
jgi:hypothetical protein